MRRPVLRELPGAGVSSAAQGGVSLNIMLLGQQRHRTVARDGRGAGAVPHRQAPGQGAAAHPRLHPPLLPRLHLFPGLQGPASYIGIRVVFNLSNRFWCLKLNRLNQSVIICTLIKIYTRLFLCTRGLQKWRQLSQDSRLWSFVSMRPEVSGINIPNIEFLVQLVRNR